YGFGGTSGVLGTSGFTSSGLQNGETIGSVTLTTNDTDSTSGNYKAGTYTITYVSGSLTVNKASLTVTATGVNKVYDGTTAATVNLSDNRVTNDVFSDSYTGAAFSPDGNVGTGKTVNVSGVSISGTDAGNYTFNTTASTTANITVASLTITATNQTHTYGFGGSSGALGTSGFTSSGLQNGETIGSVTLTTNDTDSTSGNYKAGTYSLTPSNPTGGTFTASNYTITYVSGSLTVNKGSLTVTATGVNKVYDGTTSATVTFSDDRITNDVFTDSATSAAFSPDGNVGTGKTINVSGINISGTDAANYALQNTASTTANITVASLTITATNQTHTYGFGGSSGALGT